METNGDPAKGGYKTSGNDVVRSERVSSIVSDLLNESDNNGSDEYQLDDNNLESNLRRRKGKIISCAKETLENASRQIRRKVPYAGHLMTPRRLWLNKIPTQCDVVIEFPVEAPEESLKWILGRIRSQPPVGLGLQAHVKQHDSTKHTLYYITAPINILYKAAEEARLPKKLRPDLGGTLREFTARESHCFEQRKYDDGELSMFTSQERQWLVLQILQGWRANQSDLDELKGRAAVVEGQSIVAGWQETGLITQIFPLHESKALTNLQMNWVRKIFAPQPLDDIAEYFGVKVALYFAWLGHYTCALGVPAVFGTLLWAGLWGRSETIQDIGHVLFSLFNVVWASLYLEAWRRYSVELAFRWGTLSTPPELLEPPRPLYKGRLIDSPVTGRLEPEEAPAWKRRVFRYLVSFPIIGLCLLLVFLVMFAMLRLQDWWDARLPESGIISCLSVIPKVLLAGAITLMDEAYYRLAVWLNDKENYRHQSKYENHLIAKVALFQFVNSFLSLFYIAFYLRDQEKLKEQLAGLLISRQIIGNLRESALPYAIEQWKLAKLSFNLWGALSPTQESYRSMSPDMSEPTESSGDDKKRGGDSQDSPGTPKRSIGQAEIESSMCKFDGTFADHLEMLVQMGYVVLFSSAFPLAGLCALANNLLEIRSDAFKLAHVHQRPFGQRVANIGTWQNALSCLGLVAVIVNCALIGLSGQVSRLLPGLTSAQTIILIVTLEHIMLGLRSALTWLLPELPSWLAAEIARAEHCKREIQCKGASPRPTPPSPPPSAMSVSQQDLQKQVSDDLLIGDQSMGSQDDNVFDSNIDLSVKQRKSTAQSSIDAENDIHKLENSGKMGLHNIPDIPPFTGYGTKSKGGIQIPEIPPFRKKSTENMPTRNQSVTSTNKIPEIPPFKPRKTSDSTSIKPEHLQLPLGQNNAEWMKRLKGNENPNVHRSIDCIAAPAKDSLTAPEPSELKPAPSWTNILNPSDGASTSSVMPKTPTADEEAIKAAELAAKKTRIKQSLVKRARSVAIFSLKLKERRARDAEKAAAIAVEHAKQLAQLPPPSGELSWIPIEKLIQMDNVGAPTTTKSSTNNSGSNM